MKGNVGSQCIWLSHILTNDTPLYGGSSGIAVKQEKAIKLEDSCNTTVLTMPSHAGTHVDSPYHFLANGKRVDQYAPEDWFFNCPHIVFFSAKPGQLITPEDISLPEHISENTDLLLLCSGFEKYRGLDLYWQEGPGLSPELADYFVEHCPKLRAVGVDFISISSLMHREEGRAAHRTFLEKGIMLFEDMRLSGIRKEERLEKVVALPLRFSNGDGAPCTIAGWLDDD
ncbi:MAG: cyclase family protein [Deltaproteobacteria bacterium]|nr:cyclase family protein [Deltaproteobacteria bacterium]